MSFFSSWIMCVYVCVSVRWVTVESSGVTEKGSEVEVWPWNTLGGRVDKLEKIFSGITQWNRSDLFFSWNSRTQAKFAYIVFYLLSILSRQGVVKESLGMLYTYMLCIFIWCCRRKIPAGEIYAHCMCPCQMCVLTLDRGKCFLSLTGCLALSIIRTNFHFCRMS